MWIYPLKILLPVFAESGLPNGFENKKKTLLMRREADIPSVTPPNITLTKR